MLWVSERLCCWSLITFDRLIRCFLWFFSKPTNQDTASADTCDRARCYHHSPFIILWFFIALLEVQLNMKRQISNENVITDETQVKDSQNIWTISWHVTLKTKWQKQIINLWPLIFDEDCLSFMYLMYLVIQNDVFFVFFCFMTAINEYNNISGCL